MRFATKLRWSISSLSGCRAGRSVRRSTAVVNAASKPQRHLSGGTARFRRVGESDVVNAHLSELQSTDAAGTVASQTRPAHVRLRRPE